MQLLPLSFIALFAAGTFATPIDQSADVGQGVDLLEKRGFFQKPLCSAKTGRIVNRFRNCKKHWIYTPKPLGIYWGPKGVQQCMEWAVRQEACRDANLEQLYQAAGENLHKRDVAPEVALEVDEVLEKRDVAAEEDVAVEKVEAVPQEVSMLEKRGFFQKPLCSAKTGRIVNRFRSCKKHWIYTPKPAGIYWGPKGVQQCMEWAVRQEACRDANLEQLYRAAGENLHKRDVAPEVAPEVDEMLEKRDVAAEEDVAVEKVEAVPQEVSMLEKRGFFQKPLCSAKTGRIVNRFRSCKKHWIYTPKPAGIYWGPKGVQQCMEWAVRQEACRDANLDQLYRAAGENLHKRDVAPEVAPEVDEVLEKRDAAAEEDVAVEKVEAVPQEVTPLEKRGFFQKPLCSAKTGRIVNRFRSCKKHWIYTPKPAGIYWGPKGVQQCMEWAVRQEACRDANLEQLYRAAGENPHQ
ncbi:MAG: hypothetical protein M1826_004226 [Phylliscum demangeonii]|nr:MAG: hypothetical protein M1826_004226 [Phylliscum demangeonii]